MTDLHSHILPGIDDGAKDISASAELLQEEFDQGVRNIALTSHFNCESISLDEFLDKRAAAYERIVQAKKEVSAEINLKTGAEVYFNLRLREMDVEKLCLDGTKVLLLELPINHRPAFFKEVVSDLQTDGIIPMIAHVERYRYIAENPAILADWIQSGIYPQINAETLLENDKYKKFALKILKWGLVGAVSTDTHSLKKRPPRLKEAMAEVEKHLGSQKVAELENNAELLFSGEEPQINSIHYPKRILGRWI